MRCSRLFAILNVAELRLRSQKGCGLVLDQKTSFVKGHLMKISRLIVNESELKLAENIYPH
jgi:hypothetical protein